MKHYVNEVGTDIILDTGKALATASVLKIKYQKPDGTTGEWSGTIEGTTQVKHALSQGDIDQAGTWVFQSYVEIDGGKWHGETAEISFASLFDANSFTDLAKVKAMIGQSVDQTDDDALLENLIVQNTKKVQTYTKRSLIYGTYIEYYDGTGGSAIFTDNFPIDEITSLHDDIDRVFGADTLIAVADQYVDGRKGIVRLINGLRFNEGDGNIKVVYTGGFKVIPKDIELACSQLVFADYSEIKGGINAIDGETTTYKPKNLRDQAYSVLDKYQKMTLL